MKKVVKLTESDITKIIRKVMNEQGVAGNSYKVHHPSLRGIGWRVVKDDGKVLIPDAIKNGVVGCVYADDYDYILTGQGNDTYACKSEGKCYSCTTKVVNLTPDFKAAKKNVGLLYV